MSTTPDQLVGTWLHSHEEDTASERVYRRSGFAFPPSRGRNGYDFRSDRSATYIGIAARDGSTETECKWQLRAGAQPEIVLTLPGGQPRVLQVVSIEPDRLRIRKP